MMLLATMVQYITVTWVVEKHHVLLAGQARLLDRVKLLFNVSLKQEHLGV